MFNLLLKEGFDSLHLFEKINVLPTKQVDRFSIGLNWIKENNIDLVLVGGTAVVHYLSQGRDLTPDIDFLVSNINDLKKKLDNSNIEYTNLMDFSGKNIGITVDDFNMDFLSSLNGKKEFSDIIFNTSSDISIGGQKVKVISSEMLSIVKFDLGREKDLKDAFDLLLSRKVSRKKYEILANGLKKVLSEPESVISYAEMIK